jgi:hypothetical protein
VARVTHIHNDHQELFETSGLLEEHRGPDRSWLVGWLAELYDDCFAPPAPTGTLTGDWLLRVREHRGALAAAWRLGGAEAMLALAEQLGLRV